MEQEKSKTEEKEKTVVETAEKKQETKTVEEKKKQEKPVKTEAIVNGKDLPISTKCSRDICKFIKGKKIETAVSYLEDVLRKKRALPMRGEIPHRKGRMMSGRYPQKASREFIKLLKSLKANAEANGLTDEKIILAIANKASSPHRRGGGMRFKRTHVFIKAEEKKKPEAKKAEEKK